MRLDELIFDLSDGIGTVSGPRSRDSVSVAHLDASSLVLRQQVSAFAREGGKVIVSDIAQKAKDGQAIVDEINGVSKAGGDSFGTTRF
jgi:hypothetical protein